MVEEISEGAPPETVLVAEDDVLVRMVIADYLRGCGYRVVEARGADEALEILRDSATRVDIVLCGIAMGGDIDAFGLASWIAANRTNIDVVLAGSIPRAAHVASELCDAGGPRPKRYEPRAVVERIRRLRAARAARNRARAS